jgi:uncharacterized protein (UPF0332 family)
MFDAARGVLENSKAIPNVSEIKTHAGLISMFSLHLVKSGMLDIQYSKGLNQVQEIRLAADYTGDSVEKAKALFALKTAQAFVDDLLS